MTQQIWKDYYVDLSAYLTDGACDYELRKGADTLYTGRAYAAPDGTCKVRVNDVCADWLGTALPDVSALAFTADDSLVAFALYVGGSKVEDIVLYRDWSYDRGWDPYTGGVSSAPIRLEADIRMPILQSRLTADSVTVDVRGTATTVSVTGSGVIAVPAQGATGTVTIGDVTWKLVETCRRWALYYVNAYGGWDQLTLEGGQVAETYGRSTIDTDYDNNYETARGTRVYREGVGTGWSLRTGLLTDEQAALMRHVTGTVEAFLYDMEQDEWYPVTVQDAGWQEKAYRWGKRRVEYTLDVALAQERIRR